MKNTNEFNIPKENIENYLLAEINQPLEEITKPSNEFNQTGPEFKSNSEKKQQDYSKLIRKMGYLVASSVAVLTIANASSRTLNIPADAIEFNGHYYKVYDERYTWTEAQELCKELGGHLVVITSKEEQQFIESINHVPRWIGFIAPLETNEKGNYLSRGEGQNGFICEWDYID